MKFKNPIIYGYNPDPSICRLGDYYYIANSSFEFFPGVPIYHSKNLVNWELINYCLKEKSQLYLENSRQSGGIYAPMLAYHDGEFFMTTTNVSHKGHLIVHTKDIRGEWSEPVWVDQRGIDPTLFWDDDGKVYFASTEFNETGKQGIFMCEINPYTGEKLTESACISYGWSEKCPEGPHLYKWFGKYYLLMAEGGTEYGHMVTLQRADSIWGPYEDCPHNPILSHRIDNGSEVFCTGHADMMEDENGNWWLVCLGVRTNSSPNRFVFLHHLGRETFLTPVTWTEDGWPIIGNNGKIAIEMEGPLPGTEESFLPVCRDFADDFSDEKFSLHYNFLRNPEMENYVRDVKNKELILKGTGLTLNDMASPTWIGVKQKEFAMEAEVAVSIKDIKNNQMRAGLTAFYNDCYHYEIYVTEENETAKVCLAKKIHDMFAVTASAEIIGTVDSHIENIKLKITADSEKYNFYYESNGEYVLLGSGSTAGLSTEGTMMMTFTGTYIGMFAENGTAGFKEFLVKVVQ